EARRQGRGVLLFLSCRNYPRETVSDRLRQPVIRDESCKYRKPDSPALLSGAKFSEHTGSAAAGSLSNNFEQKRSI
ncbi:MAG: hypothetical protein DRI57_30290, partial [Deltaproteobacteria bacterium]